MFNQIKIIMDTIVKERLLAIIGSGRGFDQALGFVVSYGANPIEMADAIHIAYWLEGAPPDVKREFLNRFDDGDDHPLRVCSYCGCFMHEGYILGGDFYYACSDECAVKLYQHQGSTTLCPADARRDLEYDLEHFPDDCFWTEWY